MRTYGDSGKPLSLSSGQLHLLGLLILALFSPGCLMIGESCSYRSRGDCLSGVSMRAVSCRRRAVTPKRLTEDLNDSPEPSTPWPHA